MRIIWKETDLIGGRYIIHNSYTIKNKNIAFASTVAFKIGWTLASMGSKEEIMLISLSDGLCQPFRSKLHLCNFLNNDIYGFRPLDGKTMGRIIKHQKKLFKQ